MKAPLRMPVVPVMDLRHGLAVQAVRGERATYRPVQGVLAASADPLILGRALLTATGCRAMYVADLDAIMRDNGADAGHWDTLTALAASLPCELWVDAGIADPDGAARVLATGAGQVIAGTETLAGLSDLEDIGAAVGTDKVIVSLDVKCGAVLSRTPELSGLPPLAALDLLAGHGFERFILLTLDGVGTGGGPDWGLLEPARAMLPEARLIAGGGVRNIEDLRRAATLGLDGVLTATALHRGWITPEELRAAPEDRS